MNQMKNRNKNEKKNGSEKKKKEKKKSDKEREMDKLKEEVEMDDHQILLTELCRRLDTHIETVSGITVAALSHQSIADLKIR